MSFWSPPAYEQTNSGFPPGYFMIRSAATGKVLDVTNDETADGTEILLWNQKEQSLVEGMRRPEADNQVFFVDDGGALCSKPSGHALDVEEGHLVIRHRRPVIQPYPNAYSHPLPTFTYDPSTAHIEVLFACDPAYPVAPRPSAPSTSSFGTSTAWQEKAYFLTSVPSRRKRTIIDHAGDLFSNTATALAGPLSFAIPMQFGLTGTKPATVQDVAQGEFDLREDEVLELERAEEDEVDDAPEIGRTILVVGVRDDEKGGKRTTPQARERRRWEVLPILRERLWTRTA